MSALIVNLFGAPGAGKSTTRAGVFHRLKLAGVNAEECTEYAKDLTWEKRHMALSCQPYVFGKQLRNMERLIEQVDVIVTDSPILLSAYYGQKYCPGKYRHSFYEYVSDQFDSMGGMNYVLRRVKPFNPAGRNQTESGSDSIATELEEFLEYEQIEYAVVLGNESAAATIAFQILDQLHSNLRVA
jgi:hypothetical protein